MSDRNLEIATTILNQLGGRRFVAMTGAKNFYNGDSMLLFRLPSKFATNGINAVKIELTPMDTYQVTFTKVWGTKLTEISKYDDVYCDQLRGLFESETGLYTSL